MRCNRHWDGMWKFPLQLKHNSNASSIMMQYRMVRNEVHLAVRLLTWCSPHLTGTTYLSSYTLNALVRPRNYHHTMTLRDCHHLLKINAIRVRGFHCTFCNYRIVPVVLKGIYSFAIFSFHLCESWAEVMIWFSPRYHGILSAKM